MLIWFAVVCGALASTLYEDIMKQHFHTHPSFDFLAKVGLFSILSLVLVFGGAVLAEKSGLLHVSTRALSPFGCGLR